LIYKQNWDLFSAVEGDLYHAQDEYDALKNVAQAVIGTLNIDAVRQYRNTQGRSIREIVAEKTHNDNISLRLLRELGL
jgi:hypothetical protein